MSQAGHSRHSPREAGRLRSRLEARLSSARLLRPPISGGSVSRRFSERSRCCRVDRVPSAVGSVCRRLWVTARKVRAGRAPSASGSSERRLRDSRRAPRPRICGTQSGSVSRLLKLRSRWTKRARPPRLDSSVVREPGRQAPSASRHCPPGRGRADVALSPGPSVALPAGEGAACREAQTSCPTPPDRDRQLQRLE